LERFAYAAKTAKSARPISAFKISVVSISGHAPDGADQGFLVMAVVGGTDGDAVVGNAVVGVAVGAAMADGARRPLRRCARCAAVWKVLRECF